MPMPTDAPPPIVVRDVFPAEVTVGATIYRTARALVTRDRVHVFIAGTGSSPSMVLDAAYDPEQSVIPARESASRKPAHLVLAGDRDGVQVHINRQRGCGCGNPLKTAAVSWLLPNARLGAA